MPLSNKLIILTFVFSLWSCVSPNIESNAGEKTIVDSSINSEPLVVSIYKFKYIPEVLEIKAGQTVRWINNEKRQYHSVWFKEKGEEDSDYIFPTEFLDKTFDTPGEYNYRCGPHPEMIAKIIVK